MTPASSSKSSRKELFPSTTQSSNYYMQQSQATLSTSMEDEESLNQMLEDFTLQLELYEQQVKGQKIAMNVEYERLKLLLPQIYNLYRQCESEEIKEIGRAVQQECRDRSRMPSSA
eukprot:TRINITY_DN80579_c0_g1_i1.p1 TRINITY_DN80579_c0_g1~~TRINITY_DN80579_c0_g1_i1.p1  ORF type:complete len:116 (-),score=31.36 TRINITY_DN80579_c0_g1_i1:10-357(-)